MTQLMMRCLIMAALVAFAGPVAAQEGDAGERLLEETRRARELEQLTRAPAGQVITTPEVLGVVAEIPCFPIDDIAVTGMTVYGTEDVASVLAGFRGQCLGQTSIGNLLARLTARYADAGYITTRAYVPAQDISSRTLRIEVLEGRIEAYVYQQTDQDGNQRAAPPRKIRSALPQRTGDVFQLRDLEQGLEQMNRLRSSQVNANLIAGGAPGTSRVVLTEQKSDTVRATFGLNNRGSNSSGKTQVSLGLEADDLLRLNDSWSLSYSGAKDSNTLAMAVSVPYRKWLFSLNGSYSEELSALSPASDLFTQTASVNLTAERLLFRNAQSKLYGFGRLGSYWNERFVNVVALTPQHRSSARLGLRGEHRTDKAAYAGEASIAFGIKFGGADWTAAGAPAGSPHADFAKLEARLTYVRPLKQGRQLSVFMAGQYADMALFANDQMTIGGWESVRGYAGHSVSGDSGAYFRTELSLVPVRFGETATPDGPKSWLGRFRGGVRPFLFVDAGAVRAHATRRSSGMLSGGVGFSGQAGRLIVNGALAVPLATAGGQARGSLTGYVGLFVRLF